MLLDYFKHFHLVERVTPLSSSKAWLLKCTDIFMPFHQRNSVFSCEFWWRWLCFEWEQNAGFPNSFKTLQAGTYLVFALAYLCLTWQSATGNNWGKTSLRLKLFWNKECKYRILRSIKAGWFKVVGCWLFSSPLLPSVKWNFCRKRPDSAECFTSNKSHFSDGKLFHPSFFQPDLQLTLFWAGFIPLLNMFPCNRDSPKALGKESKQLWVLQRVEVALARRVRCPATTNPACDVTPFQVPLPLSKTLKRALIDWTQLLLKSPAYDTFPVKMQGTGEYERRPSQMKWETRGKQATRTGRQGVSKMERIKALLQTVKANMKLSRWT